MFFLEIGLGSCFRDFRNEISPGFRIEYQHIDVGDGDGENDSVAIRSVASDYQRLFFSIENIEV